MSWQVPVSKALQIHAFGYNAPNFETRSTRWPGLRYRHCRPSTLHYECKRSASEVGLISLHPNRHRLRFPTLRA